jgi:predicted nucleotidyltransferase
VVTADGLRLVVMNRNEAIEILRTHAGELRHLGVARAALFGSIARGQTSADSDVDILVELDPAADLDVYDYVGVVQFIERLFPVPVDVANRESLKSHVRPEAERDAIYAF